MPALKYSTGSIGKKLGNFFKNEKKEDKKPDNEGKEEWSSNIDFFLSALGYAVGVGNVWRFPYLCYKNGGGVFIIPYFICMILLGVPLVYLEFIVGQFSSKGPIKSWRMVRIGRGIGFSMNVANSFLIMFYNMIIAYSLYFLIMSFTSELPWEKCNPKWASPNCIDDFSKDKFTYNRCSDTDSFYKCETKSSDNFGRCFNKTAVNTSTFSCDSFERVHSVGVWKSGFPSQDYWQKVILEQSPSIDDSGYIVWQLIVALICAYIIIYLMLIRGIKVSGKLVWFTALFPYVVLLILGIRGWLLPGADVGIKFYILPDWSRLGDINVWNDAATQIFFTLSVSYGGMATLSSYNNFNSNILRDAIIIPVANCFTSFFAGFVIFSYMGYLSHVTGQDIDDIIQAGQGLAYVVYPYAVTTISGAPFWAILFFIMMVLLGIDSSHASVEVSLTCIFEQFPQLKSTKRRRLLSITIIFIIYFLCGIIFTLQSGTYWIEFFNNYAGDWATLLIGAFECICISYFYGLKNLRNDIRAMIGPKYTDNFTYYIWCALWSFFTPVTCITVTIITFTRLKTLSLGGEKFPEWTLVLGELMTTATILPVFAYAVYAVIDVIVRKKSFFSLFKPDFNEFKPKREEPQRIVRIYRGLEKEDLNSFDKELTDNGFINMVFTDEQRF